MSKNGMAGRGRSTNYVSLSSMPDPKTEYIATFSDMSGGLNTYDLPQMLKANESPDMKNMMWKDGALSCRPGQVWFDSSTQRGAGHTCFGEMFHGAAFFHIGNKLYYSNLVSGLTQLLDLTTVAHGGTATSRGTFFKYNGNLYYKAPGVFVKISHANNAFSVSDIAAEAYVPITVINADAATAAGDLYQPENRLSPKKTVWYNAISGKDYYLPVKDAAVTVTVISAVMSSSFTYTDLTGLKVNADPTTWQSAWDAYDYVYYPSTGHILLKNAAYVSTPPTNNTVRVTYSLANATAMANIMDCPYAAVFGGTQELCIVVGGCTSQPNAYFWNGNNATGIVDSYWPMDQYNLANTNGDKITGFGKQQSMLVIFSENSIGRATMDMTTINDRAYITMNYTPINDKTGCDLPWTIQLVENNLVFCNREQGIHYIKDSSAAYENNVVHISRKVNGTASRSGILNAVRKAADGAVCSFDDNEKYWLVIDGQVYVWDYVLSEPTDPSIFYFTNIKAVAILMDDNDTVYHLDALGRVTRMANVFSDYNAPIAKKYTFPVMFFSTYDRLKDITSVIFALKSSSKSAVTVTYKTDWEERADKTDLETRAWSLVPRDLSYRDLACGQPTQVFRRRPGCRHVRHFQMILENNESRDMGVIFAQIFYKFQGRER